MKRFSGTEYINELLNMYDICVLTEHHIYKYAHYKLRAVCPNLEQGSHQQLEKRFPDFSLTSKEMSLTILSTTDLDPIVDLYRMHT